MATLTEKIQIKLLPDERIVNVQRRHWLALLLPLLFHLMVVSFFTAVILLLIYTRYQYLFLLAAVYFFLFILSLLAVFGTFQVMDWYFNFYIITNKRIINEHFFKVSGAYYEEVFLQENIESADRVEKNIIYDFFGIEDIKVHFANYERSEPFVFHSPENPEQIEDIIETFSARENKSKMII